MHKAIDLRVELASGIIEVLFHRFLLLPHVDRTWLCLLHFRQCQRQDAVFESRLDLCLIDSARKLEASCIVANVVFGIYRQKATPSPWTNLALLRSVAGER